jgi:hypothetical protein
MKKLVLYLCLLALAQVSVAEDYLLDATTMTVGTTSGENLVVKEGCLDPGETGCSDKYKWFGSVSPIKIGNLQVIGNVTGDFEIVLTVDFTNDSKTIQLLTADNKGISLKFRGDFDNWSFKPNGIGEGGDSNGYQRLSGWSYGNKFNELKISAKNGVANVYTNGQVAGEPINFDSGVVFERVAIEGITSKDRLVDVKVRGIQGGSCPVVDGDYETGRQACINNPSSCGIISGTDQLPTIAPNLNLHIPSLDYQSLGGSMNLWVDLQFTTTDDGKMWWILDDYGVNP